MNHLTLSIAAAAAFAASASAQSQSLLMTFSQAQQSLSTSGGTVLGNLLPNEIHHVDYFGPCSAVSAEKWMPRTAEHVMAGDENGDGQFYRTNLFGQIDGLLAMPDPLTGLPTSNQRDIFWSPTAPMQLAISALPFRPGDVGRLNAGGQVQHFMSQEQFNMSLGLPPGYGIDIDAIAFQPNFGVYFSVDVNVAATTACGPMLVRDGDVLCIPTSQLMFNTDMTIFSVVPNSAVVVYNEATMNAFTAAAQVTDRFGACLTAVGDVESLEIDLAGPVNTIVPCPGWTLTVPNLLYSSENGTGASVLETAGGGAIRNSTCGPMGTSCGFGPTLGFQVGIQPFSGNIGAPSYVNALADTRTCRFVLEPQQHVMTVPLGAPLGFNNIDYYCPFPIGLSFIQLTSPPVPFSVPAFPFSLNCFPDLYTTSLIPWQPIGPGFGSFPSVAIPPAWSGKVLYQAVGFGGSWELSTPAVVDVN